MSSSRNRQFRRRADGDDNEDETKGTNTHSITPSTTSTMKFSSKPSSHCAKPKKPHNQAPKLLSFAGDEENDTPVRSSSSRSSNPDKHSSRVGKPSSSHKITALKDRTAHSSAVATSFVTSNVQPLAGTYTKEALRELQKNTRTLASSRPATEPKPSVEPIIVLKGLVKPMDTISQIVSEATKLDTEDEGDDGKGRMVGFFQEHNEEDVAQMALMGIGEAIDSSESSIPDQATINAIRAKRERMRQSRAAAADYIAIDSGSNHGAAEGLSDEEPEFQGRIAMIGGKSESRKKGVFEEVEEKTIDVVLTKNSEEIDEEDEEKIWEEEQFRKGLGKRMDDGSTRVESNTVPSVPIGQQQKFAYPVAVGYSSIMPNIPAATSIGGSILASQDYDVMPVSQQAEVTMKALHENMRKLKESHGKTMLSLTKTDENLSASLMNITDLEKSLSAAGEKFLFMQKLRDFVSVICEFLQHKAPFIEELEEQMQKLHEERASAILERRAADNDDEMMEIEAAVKAAMPLLNKKGSSDEIIAAAKNAAQIASSAVKEQANLPMKLDEYGRDLNLQKRMDMKRRAEARKRRASRFDSKRISSMEVDSSYQKIEGESSSDESDSDSAAYKSNRDQLLQTADQIFSDAAEEYSQLSAVKERLEEWKMNYPLSYRDAYMTLSVPSIFSPYVRLELLKWDPLHEDSDFFDMKWHSLLFNYGIPENGSDFASNDADANLVPGLVEKVALPILHHEISHCWDVLSTRETNNAVSASTLVINYIPASSEALAELLLVIHNRLSDAVSNLMVPTWSPLVLKAVPNASRAAAYRFGTSVRLMTNICLWKEILAMPILEKLVLDELLFGKVLPHVRSITGNVHDAVTRTERIIASLSGVWTRQSAAGDLSRKLQPLVDYVLMLGKTLEKKQSLGGPDSETRLARRLKKMLVELNDYDKAREIVKTFHLREAL